MIRELSIAPYQIQDYTVITSGIPGSADDFPFLSVDRDSYIAGLEIQTGINFDPAGGRHCIAVGKGCSLAKGITFLIDLNHDYGAVAQGEWSFLRDISRPARTRRKGTILIQNDVWVGQGATVMAGVTLHNGCVAAAGAVVTKDVPPYAVVGGNPAKILRYRFDSGTIDALQRIAWWDWPQEVLWARRADFALPVSEFVRKYAPPALPPAGEREEAAGKTVLLVPDVKAKYPLYPKVLAQYFAKDRPHANLLLYLPEEASAPEHIRALEAELRAYEDRDCCVTLQAGVDLDEDFLFRGADYFVTTRDRETIRRTCLADRWGTEILYGTDEPLFPEELC